VAQDAILKAAGSGIYEMRWNDAELTMGGKASAGGISVFSFRHVQFFSHCLKQNMS
jgi:hypothetical protein